MKCPQCKKNFNPDSKHPHQKFCSRECGKLYRRLNPPATKQTQPTKTLEQWSREALECNLDYGNYRALIAAGKTYEDLKATAATRQPVGHARAPKTYFH